MSEMSVLLMAVGAAVGATAFLHALDKYARDRQFGVNTVPSERQMLLDRVKELESQVQFLLNQLQAANAQIVELQREVNALRASQNSRPLPAETLRVLAIWPLTSMPLSGQEDERRILYDTLVSFTVLRGDDATRNGVLRTLERQQFDVVQVGSHGQEGSIFLTDGEASPGWWARAFQRQSGNILCMVLLACSTNEAGRYNVADALLGAGIPAVVAVSSQLRDEDAIAFARMFYEQLARGASLPAAFNFAQLSMSDAGAEMITLRRR